jgi:hypothetical protein
MSKTMVYTLERRTIFLAEGRSKAYIRYVARVLEAKILLCAKNGLQEQTCFALGRHGV